MQQALISLVLIIVNVAISYRAFKNPALLDKLTFKVDRVLIQKQYHSLVSSGFVHLNWWHLGFNMLALYLFGRSIEPFLGPFNYLLIYFAGLIGGNLLALLIHKNDGSYSAVGASGAVNAIIYSSIVLFPNTGIGFFFIPVSIPAWLFGLAYVALTIYGIQKKWGNTGHEAHLGGALVGMLLTILIYPQAFATNLLPVLLVLLPTLGFILLITYKPHILVTKSIGVRKKQFRSVDHEFNYKRALNQAQVDQILEKIHRKGMRSLSEREKEILAEYSRRVE